MSTNRKSLLIFWLKSFLLYFLYGATGACLFTPGFLVFGGPAVILTAIFLSLATTLSNTNNLQQIVFTKPHIISIWIFIFIVTGFDIWLAIWTAPHH